MPIDFLPNQSDLVEFIRFKLREIIKKLSKTVNEINLLNRRKCPEQEVFRKKERAKSKKASTQGQQQFFLSPALPFVLCRH
jgi:hypothetical protein